MKKRILSILLVIFVLFSSVPVSTVQAANRKLKLETAKAAALSTDSKYQQLQNKLSLTKVKYDQAVKKLKLKERNQRTFRWSPLLSFKCPESPSLADEFEYAYKPLEFKIAVKTACSSSVKLISLTSNFSFGLCEAIATPNILPIAFEPRSRPNIPAIPPPSEAAPFIPLRLLLSRQERHFLRSPCSYAVSNLSSVSQIFSTSVFEKKQKYTPAQPTNQRSA